MVKFGKDRVFAGDYSKYDQRMPTQMILAALSILIDLAKECNYTDEDLKVMRAMCGDLAFAYIAYDGDMISLVQGGHISGNSLTVVINSIVGSLNLRCHYFYEYPEEKDSFRDHVAIITYGDDNKGSVSADRPKFNIKRCSEFLARYGQTYTMPDKESELVPYMKDEEAEFLKRNSVYHPALGYPVAALAEDSIFKSLHNYVRGADCELTEEDACAQNIDSALREWFNHGRETYEKRRVQMQSIAQATGISHLCSRLDVNYSTCCKEWREKYLAKPGDAGC
jgi:hypothetical protein